MPLILLDTNACIGLIRGRAPALLTRLDATAAQDICTSAIVCAELLHGANKSDNPTLAHAKVSRLLEHMTVLHFDRIAAVHYGDICATLERTGKRIGWNDLLIAATARANAATVITRNLGEFRRVPDLVVEAW